MRSPDQPDRLSFFSAVLAVVLAVSAAHAMSLERGIAITDLETLRELDLRQRPAAGLDTRGFSLARMLGADPNASSTEIFDLPAVKGLRAALDREFEDYAAKQSAADSIRLLPFDRDALYARQTRFILAGIVNRMDRAYKSPATCGEIRLIYRPVANYGKPASARLPMTLNVVLNVRNDTDRQIISCAEVARRWLALRDRRETGSDLALSLIAKGAALEFATPAHIARIETNIQIARASANPNDFEARADYLMKVFDYDTASRMFVEVPMENQIDRERILADASLANEFRQWMLTPDNFAALDKGTVLIPDKFLAKRAVVVTPAAVSNTEGIFAEIEIVEALAKADRANVELQNIKSPAGFARRLNDSTCAGCHQTRAIGGFHFPGVDWSGDAPSFVVTPASPHFFGDQPRRSHRFATPNRWTSRADFRHGHRRAAPTIWMARLTSMDGVRTAMRQKRARQAPTRASHPGVVSKVSHARCRQAAARRCALDSVFPNSLRHHARRAHLCDVGTAIAGGA